MGRINVKILNMFLVAEQAVKLLDLSHFPLRPATIIQSELERGRNGNMLKIGGILPTHVMRLKPQDSQNERENEKAQEITERQVIIFTARVRTRRM